MRTRKTLRLLIATLALAATALLLATAANAAVTIEPISWQDQLFFSDVGLVPCYPNLAGTLTGTDTGAGQFLITNSGVHVEGVETQTYRIDFDNGWYLLSSSPTHFNFNYAFANNQAVSTAAQQDRGTLYDASGNVIGSLTVWGVTHLTWRDLNANGQPDPGEITANVSLSKFSCP